MHQPRVHHPSCRHRSRSHKQAVQQLPSFSPGRTRAHTPPPREVLWERHDDDVHGDVQGIWVDDLRRVVEVGDLQQGCLSRAGVSRLFTTLLLVSTTLHSLVDSCLYADVLPLLHLFLEPADAFVDRLRDYLLPIRTRSLSHQSTTLYSPLFISLDVFAG